MRWLPLALLLTARIAHADCYGAWDVPATKRYAAVIEKLRAQTVAARKLSSPEMEVHEQLARRDALVTLASDPTLVQELIDTKLGAVPRLELLAARFPATSYLRSLAKTDAEVVQAEVVGLQAAAAVFLAVKPQAVLVLDLAKNRYALSDNFPDAERYLKDAANNVPLLEPALGFYGQTDQQASMRFTPKCDPNGATVVTEYLQATHEQDWAEIVRGLSLDNFVKLSSVLDHIATSTNTVSCLNRWAKPSLTYSAASRAITHVVALRERCFKMGGFSPNGVKGFHERRSDVVDAEWDALRTQLLSSAAKPPKQE